jgi:hypothetical protein
LHLKIGKDEFKHDAQEYKNIKKDKPQNKNQEMEHMNVVLKWMKNDRHPHFYVKNIKYFKNASQKSLNSYILYAKIHQLFSTKLSSKKKKNQAG